MSRLTLVAIIVGTAGLVFAATYMFVGPQLFPTSQQSNEDRRKLREQFFKAPEENPLVGQEMRPRW